MDRGNRTAAGRLPPEWLDPNYIGVGNFPHEEMLLRWTTALDAKWKKYMQYRKKASLAPRTPT
jgi:hypothetical protein